jgi:hypothetical protein
VTLFVIVDAQPHLSSDEMIGRVTRSSAVKIAQGRNINLRPQSPLPSLDPALHISFKYQQSDCSWELSNYRSRDGNAFI